MSVQWGVVLPQGWRSDLRGIGGAAAQFEAMLGVARHAERLGFDSVWLGRDYDSILRTASFSVFTAATEAELDRLVRPHLRGRERAELAAGSAVGTPAHLVDTFNSLVEVGIQHFILYVHAPTDLDRLTLLAEQIIPHVG